MKNGGLKVVALLFLMCGAAAVSGQSVEREVPGDDFSLEGALELFKKSGSPEEFERMLNAENSKVNNLDLNGDGDVDYLRVIDQHEGNIHAFIIRAIVSRTESQDVAVIELEKLSNGKAVLQIIGDEDIYGIETIIEPTQEVRVNAGTSTAVTVVNVWSWPSVQYVYDPYYTVWVSPWGWYSRPIWWYSWRPIAYYHYHSYWRPYRPYYARCYTHRVAYAHTIYRPHRTTSVIVRGRHQTQVAQYRSAHRDDRTITRSRNDGRTANRNDYRSNRSTGVSSRSRDMNNSNRTEPALDNRNTRERTNRDANSTWSNSDNRRTNPSTRSNDRERSTVQQPRNETPARRSTPTVERSRSFEQPRTRSTPSHDRSRSFGNSSSNNRSQPSSPSRKRSR